MAKPTEPDHSSYNLVGPGTTIKGEIISSGDIRIDGCLIGKVTSKGRVIVGATGVVEGDVICQNADVSGIIKAKIQVSELLTLKSTSKIHGDIVTKKLAIEPGAIFTGTCAMENSTETTEKIPELAAKAQQKVS
jgi:cytoskeletal protein CcmA (bactofilin family)